MFFKLALSSLINRRLTVLLAVISISISTVVLLLGVEHIRHEVRDSFSKTISGADLIVGARTGQLNLLLYSVFRIGNATNNIGWNSYQVVSNHPAVSWTIPLSLSDSHRGYRVLGTNTDYFTHFRYGNNTPLRLREGDAFEDYLSRPEQPASADFAAVLGADVAARLSYQTGDTFIVSHGIVVTSFSHHDQFPVTVAGILDPTGTPVDQTIHISLETMEALHNTGPLPSSITAFIVGLESRMASFTVQRRINNYRGEPLLAILPGVALAELWQMMGTLERVLSLVSALVLVAALLPAAMAYWRSRRVML
jgi:putative ABC transport system permease protein